MAFRSATTASSSGTSVSVAVPAGVADKDIVVLVLSSDDAAMGTPTWPSGFTQLDKRSFGTDGQSCAVAWKRLTGADTGTYTVGNTGAYGCDISALAFSGRDTTNPPVLGSSTSSNNTGSSVSVTGLTVVAGDDLLFAMLPDSTASTSVFTQPSGYTQETHTSDIYGPHSTAVEQNAAAGATGTVSGSWTNGTGHGSAAYLIRIPASTGTAPHTGAASGTITLTGAATGSRSSSGAASGKITVTGSGTGSATHQGTASGAVVLSGSASGTAPPNSGTASGAVVVSGSASGSRTSSGSASGAVVLSGSASGTAPVVTGTGGAASGTLPVAGSATGSTVHQGSASGTLAVGGTAGGTTARSGVASGTLALSGSASGTAPIPGMNSGNASGVIVFVGSGTGSAPRGGTGSGTITITAVVTGSTPHEGAASGSVALSGAATGNAPATGSASGTVVFSGTAKGSNIAYRNLTVLSIRSAEQAVNVTDSTRLIAVLSIERRIVVIPEEVYMKFPVTGRKYYRLTITTNPATVGGWSASFDGGATWVSGTDEGSNVWSWLLDTPSTIGGHQTNSTEVPATPGTYTKVKLRCDDSPELLVVDVPDNCNVEWV